MQEQVMVVRIVVAVNDRFLVLRRSPSVSWSAGKYELPGGKVSLATENMPQAVRRELAEETGLRVGTDLNVFHIVNETWQQRQYVVSAFAVYLPERPRITLSDEHDDLQWVTMAELQNLATTSHTLEIMQQWQKQSPTEVNTINDAKKATQKELLIYTDGGSRGNPGPSASGFVIMDSSGAVLEEGGEYLGITTNSQAEYQAVKLALERAAAYHPQKITFQIDSEMVVQQMNGLYHIRNRDLWPVHARIKELAAAFKEVCFEQIGREHNAHADAKVNEILNSHSNKTEVEKR